LRNPITDEREYFLEIFWRHRRSRFLWALVAKMVQGFGEADFAGRGSEWLATPMDDCRRDQFEKRLSPSRLMTHAMPIHEPFILEFLPARTRILPGRLLLLYQGQQLRDIHLT
jgi:hypothetical protein